MVTVIPNVTNWTVTPINGQDGYFTLMNTWLSQSTSVIASLQSAITAQNTANSEINALAIQAENNAIIATGLANFQGAWSDLVTYNKGESVESTTGSKIYYTSKVNSNLNHAVTDTEYWLYNPINYKADISGALLINPKINGIPQSGYSGFKNLIINGRKQVNQSGLTVTNNAYNYDNHYKVGNNWFMFIDGKNIISGEPYTLSWEGVATAGYYIGTAGALTINVQTFIPLANGETITPTISSSQILWIKFASDATGSTYDTVQFEPGTAPTPYEQRLKELEELFVERAYKRYTGGSPASGIIATGVANLSLTYGKMRKIPTLLYDTAGYSIHTGVANFTISSMSFSIYVNDTSADLACSISGGTLGQAAQLRGDFGWIALDARPY